MRRKSRVGKPRRRGAAEKGLCEFRVRAGLTQEEVAEQMSKMIGRSVTKQEVSSWERGKVRNPRPPAIWAMARLYNVTEGEIIAVLVRGKVKPLRKR